MKGNEREKTSHFDFDSLSYGRQSNIHGCANAHKYSARKYGMQVDNVLGKLAFMMCAIIQTTT